MVHHSLMRGARFVLCGLHYGEAFDLGQQRLQCGRERSLLRDTHYQRALGLPHAGVGVRAPEIDMAERAIRLEGEVKRGEVCGHLSAPARQPMARYATPRVVTVPPLPRYFSAPDST